MIKLIILILLLILIFNYKKWELFGDIPENGNNQPSSNPLTMKTLKMNYKYVGCFKDNPTDIFTKKIRNKLSNDPITIQDCEDKARDANYKVYSMQNFDIANGKGECYADNDIDRAIYSNVSEKNRYGVCRDFDVVIDGNKVTRKVGDIYSNAVYTVIDPSYEFLGCFKDDPKDRKLDMDKRHIEFRFCEPVARTEGYKYYAVQDWGKLSPIKGNCFMTNDLKKAVELGYGNCKTTKVKTNYIDTNDGTLSDRIVGLENSNALYGVNYTFND